MSTYKWIWGIVIAVILLAGIQWYMVSRSTASFNMYGKDFAQNEASSTDQVAAVAAASSTVASSDTNSPAPVNTNTKITKNFMHTVTVQTSKGTIVFETYDADAPKTVENFLTLSGKGFYNGTIFHRVIPGFMIQGGDPTGTGTGGPGYKFADELNPETASYKAGYVRGTVAMANSGPNTNGSQFFIMQSDNPLPNSYSIFGKVISGMDVVDAIAKAERNSSDKPLVEISMTKVTSAAK